ncbi:CHASE4 domain-containing protein [Desulforhopalus sp. IMCC35007]|uniref:sensor histidine kinase n=1 Tax=Desulforhopalus sp. IMCC35007 TaxID=2569543 RepID=UPI0010ADBC65|nr:CHASE4 domain-containing protein [Desulforhopalus sp. IMCC35007]TKB09681.1 HAMP domain-containing protein [Desulforhopalus sp. IMCC35007]
MPITRKVSIIVILVFLLSALANLAIQQMFIMPSFIALEKETATQNAERVLAAIDRELVQITTLVTDWSHWTASYTYVQGQNPDYQADNLDYDNSLNALNMNFLGYYDTAGKTIWSRAEELETKVPLDLGQLMEAALPADHPLIQHKSIKSNIKGIVPTLQGPLLIVAGPILTSDAKGPIVGTLMMGRLLNAAAIERIGKITKLSVTAQTASQSQYPSSTIGLLIAGRNLVHTDLEMVESPDRLQVQSTLLDVFSHPILTLQVDSPRDISRQGAAAVNQSMWVLAVTGILIMLILLKLLRNTILTPLAKLTEHALFIGENDNTQARLNLKRTDEVGVLAHTFDQMVDRLAETRRRLIDQSYRSGIAEMASGVLHNIGNAITPLTVRLSTLQQELKNAPLAELEMATAELADPSTPPDRRVDLVQFVELAGGEMASLIKDTQEKVNLSIQQVDQVQEILTDQQRFSRSARVIEPVEMSAVIEDMAAGLSPEIKDVLEVIVTPSVTEAGPVTGSRVALQQVVTNLLINAAESIQSTGKGPGRVTITAELKDIQEQSMVDFLFTDNGAGMDGELIERLFERGYSSKNREGSGYGLHWSANTVQALGGQIFAESAGVGSGACMHVLLPSADNQGTSAPDSDEVA